MAIVNASSWPPTKLITPVNKTEFLNGVIHTEVIKMREGAMDSIFSGMEDLGLKDIIINHHKLVQDVFVYSPKAIFDAQCFKALIAVKSDLTDKESEIMEWFYSYVDACESKGIT